MPIKKSSPSYITHLRLFSERGGRDGGGGGGEEDPLFRYARHILLCIFCSMHALLFFFSASSSINTACRPKSLAWGHVRNPDVVAVVTFGFSFDVFLEVGHWPKEGQGIFLSVVSEDSGLPASN